MQIFYSFNSSCYPPPDSPPENAFVVCVNTLGKKSSSKGKGGKKGHGGIREEIRRLQEVLGVDDPNRTPEVLNALWRFDAARSLH